MPCTATLSRERLHACSGCSLGGRCRAGGVNDWGGVGEGRGQQGRHHLDGSIVQQEVRRAVVASGMAKPASCHTFRHSFATPRHTEPRRSALSGQGHL
jgi:hypothetical protein